MMLSVAGPRYQVEARRRVVGTNYLSVHPDGTVDLEKGATVTYASLSSAQSLAKSVNKDSSRSSRFGTTGVSFNPE